MKTQTVRIIVLSVVGAALLLAVLIVTAQINSRQSAQNELLASIDRQIELMNSISKEALLFGSLIGVEDDTRLESAIEAAKMNTQTRIVPHFDRLSEGVFEQLSKAKLLREIVEDEAKKIRRQNIAIAKESENFLSLTPRLKTATNDVIFMMEKYNSGSQMARDAHKQSELIDRFAILSAEYLANGGSARYEESAKLIDTYAKKLEEFANSDNLQASVQAQIGKNQSFWKEYQASLLSVLSSRKQMIMDINTIFVESEKLNAVYRSTKDEIRGEAIGAFLGILRLCLLLSFGVAIGLLIAMFLTPADQEQEDPADLP
ncbi:hypothetical protein FACS189487_07400 [Campylobacterota bacterium]|nr:hypothetical protein FACS189487_07400 [Campylobacterota bacterium]